MEAAVSCSSIMELRSCDAIHFIQTIIRGLPTKLRNTDSHGRPAIVYKHLKDVYDNENAGRMQRSDPDLVFDSVQTKLKYPSLPVADRTLQEIKPEPVEFVCNTGDGGSSELDDNTTLKQLRKRFLKKKRRRNQSDENILLDNANEEPVEDNDLYEPLIKLKCSKTSKTKRKCRSPSVLSSSDVGFTVKAEKDLFPEDDSLQCDGQFDQLIHVKIEVPETKQLECQYETSSANNSDMDHNEGPDPGGSASNEYPEMVQHEDRDWQHKYQDGVSDEITYNHLEDVEPIATLDGTNAKLETLESGCKDLPPLVIENGKEIEEAHSCRSPISQDATSDECSNLGGSSIMNEISEQSSGSGIQVSDMTTEADYWCKPDNFLSVPDAKCDCSSDSVILLQTGKSTVSAEGATTNKDQTSIHAFDNTMKNNFNCEVHIEDELCKDVEKQTSETSISDAESLETLSASEHVSPERLLSTRKAMPPSSQERLCMVMNSIELGSDADLYTIPDCKGKFSGKQTGKKASIVKPDIQYDKSTDSHTGPEQDSPEKLITSPRNIKKRSKIAKGNPEGPHFSRNLPNFSTGCTSIQGCSESAIAFSQRQMHDMESLAEKLMNELKSMKDIVEQKLLFEAYRNASLKNDADGVKSAINNATKVEDTARKWLSIMSRDCNRFCKIMKMTPNSTTPKDAIPRERKRIIFADEAGGKLCHVKFFGDGDLPNADDVK